MAPISDAAPINSGDRVTYDGEELNVVDRLQGSNGAYLIVAPDPSDEDDPVPGLGTLVSEGAVRNHGQLMSRLTPQQRDEQAANLRAQLAQLENDGQVEVGAPGPAAVSGAPNTGMSAPSPAQQGQADQLGSVLAALSGQLAQLTDDVAQLKDDRQGVPPNRDGFLDVPPTSETPAVSDTSSEAPPSSPVEGA